MHDPTASAALAMPEHPYVSRPAGHLELLKQHPTSPRKEVMFATLTGRCKGRGTRLVGRHIVSGKTFVVSDTQIANRRLLPQIEGGDIVVAATFPAEWVNALLAAGGLVIDVVDAASPARTFALRHSIPLISSIPNAGQFVHGELIYLLGDGRVIVAP